MTIEEKIIIKSKYKQYKRVYYALKKEYINCKNPEEKYEMLCELSYLGMEISNLRKTLLDEQFRKFYLSNILDSFIFEDEKSLGGR